MRYSLSIHSILHRVSSGIELGAYYHHQFQRDKHHLIKFIQPGAQPPQDSNTSSAPLVIPKIDHQEHFAEIQLPPPYVSDPTTTIPQQQAQADIRDFPLFMRNIAKAKQKKLLNSNRQDSGATMVSDTTIDFVHPYASYPVTPAPSILGGMMSQVYPSRGSSYPSYWDANSYSMMMHNPNQNNNGMAWNPSLAAAGMGSSLYTSGMASRYGNAPSGIAMLPNSPTSSHAQTAAAAAGQTAFDRIYRQHQYAASMMHTAASAAIKDPVLRVQELESQLAEEKMRSRMLRSKAVATPALFGYPSSNQAAILPARNLDPHHAVMPSKRPSLAEVLGRKLSAGSSLHQAPDLQAVMPPPLMNMKAPPLQYTTMPSKRPLATDVMDGKSTKEKTSEGAPNKKAKATANVI